MPTPKAYRILVTGSSGAIGQCAVRGLHAAGHFVRGFDIAPPADDLPLDEHMTGDLADRAAVDAAMDTIDSVVHLGACPRGDADFLTELHDPNIIGVYNVCEAARLAEVRRLILTSSVQVIHKTWPPTHSFDSTAPVAARNFYSATKLFAEGLSYLYHHRHKMSVILLRPGYFPREANDYESLATRPLTRNSYWSRDDAERFFVCAIEAEHVDYAILYGTSLGIDLQVYDYSEAEALIGYVPQDRYPTGIPEGEMRGE